MLRIKIEGPQVSGKGWTANVIAVDFMYRNKTQQVLILEGDASRLVVHAIHDELTEVLGMGRKRLPFQRHTYGRNIGLVIKIRETS